MEDERGAGLDKRVVRMPDGRQLIYYSFASPSPPRMTQPEPPAPGKPSGKPGRKA